MCPGTSSGELAVLLVYCQKYECLVKAGEPENDSV